MPTKNPFLRYRVIDECLQNKRKITFNRLLNTIHNSTLQIISESTLNKDIRAMRVTFKAPIDCVAKGKNRSYQYYEEFSLRKIKLSDAESKIIDSSISILNLLKKTSILIDYESIINKLVLGRDASERKDEVIQIELPIMDSGMKWFDKLYQSINKEKNLILTYQGYGEGAEDSTVSPYLLKEYRNKWYLLCYVNGLNNLKIFALDRINNVSDSLSPFKEKTDFNIKDYFEHSFGITRDYDAEPMELKLTFTGSHIPYVLSEPLHKSQEIIKQSPDSLTVKIVVYESPELNMRILGYGSYVKVLSPAYYASKIKKEIKRMNTVY